MRMNQIRLFIVAAVVILSIGILVFKSYEVGWKFPLNLGLDLQGGTRLVLEAQGTEKIPVTDDAVQGIVAVVRNRIDALGVAEPIIQRKGTDQVIVELPGVKDPERAIKLVGDTALLEFVEAEWAPAGSSVLTPEKVKEVYGTDARLDNVKNIKAGQVESETPIILKKTVLTGAQLKGAWPGVDDYGNPIVSIEFNGDGAGIFRDVTARSVGKPIAIILDGSIISAPNVREPIPSGKAQISGNFSIEEVQDMVIKLKAGSLPVPVKVIANQVVGPTLGRDSIDRSKLAGLVGFVFIFFFMLLYYRLPGLLANVALFLYIFIVAAILAILDTTLTLPGIAGFLLSIGMAVDANIIIFERLKEELREGKNLKLAIEVSFKRAFAAILDSNVTTLTAAVTLFWLGTGTIKGFAITLSVGIIASMYTSLTVTRMFMDVVEETNMIKDTKTVLLYK